MRIVCAASNGSVHLKCGTSSTISVLLASQGACVSHCKMGLHMMVMPCPSQFLVGYCTAAKHIDHSVICIQNTQKGVLISGADLVQKDLRSSVLGGSPGEVAEQRGPFEESFSLNRALQWHSQQLEGAHDRKCA